MGVEMIRAVFSSKNFLGYKEKGIQTQAWLEYLYNTSSATSFSRHFFKCFVLLVFFANIRGAVLDTFRIILDTFREILDIFRKILDTFRKILDTVWKILDTFWIILDTFWKILDTYWSLMFAKNNN